MAEVELAQRHHSELGRANAAAMQQHFQEAVEICSELLTSGTYEEMQSAGMLEEARRFRAETRLTMATAMHYNEAHHDDVLKLLNIALDSPADLQKDVYFTIAVVQLSSERPEDARVAMERCLALISEVRRGGKTDSLELLEEQEREALEFLAHLESVRKGPVH